MESNVGIENPTASRQLIHDHTNQLKAFGDVSYLIDDATRLSFLFGVSNNRFQIPNNPGQTPQFGYLDTVNFNSAQLNEQQGENGLSLPSYFQLNLNLSHDFRVAGFGKLAHPVGADQCAGSHLRAA